MITTNAFLLTAVLSLPAEGPALAMVQIPVDSQEECRAVGDRMKWQIHKDIAEEISVTLHCTQQGFNI